MRFDPRTITIESYPPREWRIECARCRREAVVDRYDMMRRFGSGITLAECARKVAALKGCNLADLEGGRSCGVRALETPPETWGSLQDARLGNWLGYLICCRQMAGLKKTTSCPELIRIDVLSVIALLGNDFPLERLSGKLKCPLCGTSRIQVEWHVPQPPLTPAPMQQPPEPVRLRPHGAEAARVGFGVVKG